MACLRGTGAEGASLERTWLDWIGALVLSVGCWKGRSGCWNGSGVVRVVERGWGTADSKGFGAKLRLGVGIDGVRWDGNPCEDEGSWLLLEMSLER